MLKYGNKALQGKELTAFFNICLEKEYPMISIMQLIIIIHKKGIKDNKTITDQAYTRQFTTSELAYT